MVRRWVARRRGHPVRAPAAQAPLTVFASCAPAPFRPNVRDERASRAVTEGERTGIEDLVNQGKEFLEQNKEKIGDALKSDQAEGVSDNVLDAAADFVKKIAPDSVDAQVDGVRDSIDKSIGNE
ncbi:antitoxin [Microbacterium aurum]|uniref:antitoxin n=1 Tax=Microbacterium aurum TaxID=36805 RepID=UPI0028E716E3|nr:antitoxin [Microbacterium aurum]